MNNQPAEFQQTTIWHRRLETLKTQAMAWWKERTARERALLRIGTILAIVVC